MKTSPKPKTVKVTLQDFYDAWNHGKKYSENYIGKPAKKSTMVRLMAEKLGLIEVKKNSL